MFFSDAPHAHPVSSSLKLAIYILSQGQELKYQSGALLESLQRTDSMQKPLESTLR